MLYVQAPLYIDW